MHRHLNNKRVLTEIKELRDEFKMVASKRSDNEITFEEFESEQQRIVTEIRLLERQLK